MSIAFCGVCGHPDPVRGDELVCVACDQDPTSEPRPTGTPWIICLCGSTRFRRQFADETRRLSLEGKIVLSVGFFRGDCEITEEQKVDLDELHLRKIDLADEVRVINAGKYVGDSTRREIEYALNERKLVTWIEGPFGTQAVCDACGYVGYAAMGQPRAHVEFRRLGWRSLPRRQDGTGGYHLCPHCADTPEEEIELGRMAR